MLALASYTGQGLHASLIMHLKICPIWTELLVITVEKKNMYNYKFQACTYRLSKVVPTIFIRNLKCDQDISPNRQEIYMFELYRNWQWMLFHLHTCCDSSTTTVKCISTVSQGNCHYSSHFCPGALVNTVVTERMRKLLEWPSWL
jgi:hypothetical protein